MQIFNSLVFSGIQPTGNIHIGNYLGAIKNWIYLQKKYKCIYCIADMHALTINTLPKELKYNTRDIAATLLALGINIKNNILFNQSSIMQHAELSWIFNCLTNINSLKRIPQFKDKNNNTKKSSIGLLTYPNLMAADILLYRATHVPVGEDQKIHLELTKFIAKKFNKKYKNRFFDLGFSEEKNKIFKEFFPIPKSIINNLSMRIMSLKDARKKMSKSDHSHFSRINLSDTPDDIEKKIKKAKTDSFLLPDTIENLSQRPEANNLVNIYAEFSEINKEQVLLEFGGKSFSIFKKYLSQLIIQKLMPIIKEKTLIKKDISYIDSVLKEGSEKAFIIAENTMKKVRKIIGYI